MSKKIVIIGGGIGGLSCAYDLNKSGFDVELYEKNKICGGQARSEPTEKGNVPYAWRIWSNYYYNFMDIIKNIPLDDTSHKEPKTMADNFVELPPYVHKIDIIQGRNIGIENTLDVNKSMSKLQKFRILMKIGNMLLMSDERLKEKEITFYDYIDPKDEPTRNWVLEFVGPIIGMEANKATLYSISKGWQITYASLGIKQGFKSIHILVTNGPYDEVIFKPWVTYLINKGVKIFTETPILKINYNKKNKTIKSVTTKYGKITGDDYIICLDQTSLNKLTKSNTELLRFPELEKVSKLMFYGNEMYFGMVIYFTEPFEIKFSSGCAHTEPWKPVLQNFSSTWKDKYIKKCNSVEILQVSCLDLVKGYNGKFLHECSVQEIIKEIFLQLMRSNILKNFKSKSGKSIWDTMSGYEIWPYWKTGKDGRIYNSLDEYKLSINSNCWDLMPTIKTPVSNLFFGSVIAKGDTPMVSMEMACSNGRTAAQAISEKYNAPVQKVFSHPGLLPIILSPIRNLDKLFFNMGLKVNWVVFIFILILCIILLIVVFIRKITRHKIVQ